jgi:hypothetical protein
VALACRFQYDDRPSRLLHSHRPVNPPTAAELEQVLETAAKNVARHATPEEREAHYVVGGLEDSVTYADFLIAVDQALAEKAHTTVPE